MKEYFDTQVKPLNEKLSESLGEKKITVTHEKVTHYINVMVTTKEGKRLSSSQLAFYRKGLGLNV